MRSRALILDATLRIVEAEGFSAVTVAAVARAAGVTRQTVYSIFGSREALVSETVARDAFGAVEQLRPRLDAAATAPEYVLELIVGARSIALTRPTVRALLTAEAQNPLLDPGMIDRARTLAAGLLEPALALPGAPRDPEAADAWLELVLRIGLSVLVFDSARVRDEADLRRALGSWLEPRVDT